MHPRAVFDCMLFLQAATSDAGPAFACFQLVEAELITLYLSRETLAEIKDVLNRPGIRRKFPHLNDDRVEEFLQRVQSLGIILDSVPRVFVHARDPDDEPYINLAIAADAAYLVTRDHDLLDLMLDTDFPGRYPTLRVINPVAFLRKLIPGDRE